METIRLYPSTKYLVKLMIRGLISLLFSGGWMLFVLGGAIISKRGFPEFVATVPILQIAVLIMLVAVILMILYFRSIRYEIHDDQVLVYIGILTKTIKHVNFRNITNMEVKRSILDRLLGLGSLSIQTAGSGSKIPEEQLKGLTNVHEVYEYLAQQLRHYHNETAQPSSRSAGNDTQNQDILIGIWQELRAIRTSLAQR